MEELYRQNVNTVYGFLLSLCRDSELANTLTQEVFLQAMESIDRYNGSCKFSVWLCQIGKHLWYRHLEKSKRQMPVGDDINDLADRQNVAPSAEDTALLNEEVRTVLSVISRMKEDVRSVMTLRLIYEYSFGEIGYILGKSENWARVTFFRGKERLIKALEESNESDKF